MPADPHRSSLVRPYVRTNGRTRPSMDLALEALLQTTELGRVLHDVPPGERRAICGVCLDTKSVAEVSALLQLPIGVTRVLVGDMAEDGLIIVHGGVFPRRDRPSIEFMERVLSGLRSV